MPSQLERVAQALVAALDEAPRVVDYLLRTAQKCRENAGYVGHMSNNPAAQMAAMQLDEAARRCEEAAHYLAQAPPKARGWAEQMVSRSRTTEPTGGPTARRPDSPDGGPPTAERRRGEDQDEPEVTKHRKTVGGSDEPSPEDEPSTPKLSNDDVRHLLERLPARKPGHKTRGVWRDSDGTDHDLISGQHEDDFHAAQRHAEKLGLVRKPYGMTTAADVELKFAMRMRREGIKHAEIVINNRPCEGLLSCDELLDRFLPDDGTLTVYGPNNFKRTYPKKPNQK